MEQNKITEAYDVTAKTYTQKFFNELDYKPLDRQLLDRFAESTKNKGVVCDIGCGPGEVANYLFSRGSKVIGIDISEKMIGEAKKMNRKIEFRVGDMLNLNIKNDFFAGICSFYAIVNFQQKDIDKILKEYNRVIKMDGILLIAFHLLEETIHIEDALDSGKPLDFYSYDENVILEVLKKTGFKINDAVIRFPYEEEYPSKRCYIFAEKLKNV